MTEKEKLEGFIKHMERLGIPASQSLPVLYRLLRRVGVHLPPPFFGSLWQNTLVGGIYFALGWGIIMWFFQWRYWSGIGVIWIALISSGVAGLVFGAVVAFILKSKAKKLDLPATWEEYTPPPFARH